MKRFLVLFVLLFVFGCCPTRSGPPADAGAVQWQPTSSDAPETVIDCGGKERESIIVRRSNTTIRHCVVRGSIRIQGPWRNANDPKLREPSRKADYVSMVRSKSPNGVTIEDVAIRGLGSVPLYIGPGVTHTTIRRVHVAGRSKGPMVYLGAESSRTIFIDSVVDARHGAREAVAVDASDHNRIERLKLFSGPSGGGIHLYRNCGEAGVSRHTTPSDNELRGNELRGSGAVVWLSSRDGRRCYCGKDNDSRFGSGRSDLDHARRNVVEGNIGTVKRGASARD